MKLTLPVSAAKLTHVNTRTEKHGEDDVLACDLDFECEITAEEILPQLCTADWKPLQSALWSEDAERKVRELSIEPLKFNNKFDDHTMKFTTDLKEEEKDIDERKGRLVTVKKIVLTPQNGAVFLMEFQVQLSKVSEKENATYCSGLVQKDVQIAIVPPSFPVGQQQMPGT